MGSDDRFGTFREWYDEQPPDDLLSDLTADDLLIWAVDAGCLQALLDLPETGKSVRKFFAEHEVPE